MNFSIRELDSLRPRLRDGLKFSVQEHGPDRVCVIEDPASSRFFRVGFDEYQFFRSLDGSEPVAVLLARLARDKAGHGFSETEAMQMLRWLKDQQLLAIDSDRTEHSREHAKRAWKATVTWLNPLLVRVPFARPDRFFAWLARTIKPLLGGFGFLIWLAVILAAFSQLAVDGQRFRHGFEGILGRDNWLWLIVVWLALKVFHECGHAVYCRHFGARVREVGAIFILFLPMGYVDATASLGFASRWRRIIVACAGVYVELFIAALAALLWVRTPDGAFATILHNTIVMGTVVTLFFNANPLMRFDGYYVLSDMAGLPNLATRARSWLMRLFGWIFLGSRKLRPDMPRTRREWFIAFYAVAAWLWQILVFVGLLLAASALLRGGGLLFAVISATLWLSTPIISALREMGGWIRNGAGTSARFIVRLAVLLAIAGALLFIPYRKTVVAPGVVEFGDTRILRTECPGFVENILVRDGDIVPAGTLLVQLRNDEASSELARVRIQLEAQKRRARFAYTRGDVAEHQQEQARVDSLVKSLREKEAYVATLQVRAPTAGRVTGRQLDRGPGTFLERGAEVLRIGQASEREVKFAVSQDAEPHFRAGTLLPVQVRIDGRGDILEGKLDRLDDQATARPPHQALTAAAGGPLAVRRAPSMGPDQPDRYELAEPHFEARARLTGNIPPLADGELARVKFESPRSVNLFQEMQSTTRRWIQRFGG